jgi:hypothetical protein
MQNTAVVWSWPMPRKVWPRTFQIGRRMSSVVVTRVTYPQATAGFRAIGKGSGCVATPFVGPVRILR